MSIHASSMWVKICANTTLADARHAAEAGANAVGFVFAPSKRQVTAEQVREISAGLPENVERVGVFGALPAAQIAAATKYARLTALQLHGGFDPALSARLLDLLGPGVSLIQTIHWNVEDSGAEANVAGGLKQVAEFAAHGRALLDAKVGSASGGLGVAFDWAAAARVLKTSGPLAVILAGGLRPENVGEAIRTVKPWGVDVASGVEASPGVKDPGKVRAFIENARRA